MSDATASDVRLDKWLWAARFFKTRAMATQAVDGGKVHVNGARVKPSRRVHPGEELRINKGSADWVVIVQAVTTKRGPAKEAEQLYEETADSRDARERQAEERRVRSAPGAHPGHRPDKRDRRRLRQVKGKDHY